MTDTPRYEQTETNEYGQAVGLCPKAWQAPAPVQSAALTQHLQGQYCHLQPLESKHAPELLAAFDQASPSLWTYLPYGPFQSLEDYENWISDLNRDIDNCFAYCIKSRETDQVLGLSAYLRMQPEAGSIEIGHLSFSPLLQQTRAATEAIFMMIDAVFMLGYRRCEWKCNDLNIPSIAAAGRFGFRFEGTFRQAMVVKGRNRNTAWFSILDYEWETLRPCYENWLAPENFTKSGRQKTRLSDMTQLITQGRVPE